MAEYNQYGLKGVAALLQLGKKGLKLDGSVATLLELKDAAGTGYVDFKAKDATFTGSAVIQGDLTVQGTTTTIDVQTLAVADHNIEIGVVDTPTDVTANGGGITLRGDTDKTIIWDSANANWTSSENWNLASGKVYKINNVEVLSATTLGSTITASSLTSVGTLTSGALGTGFATIAVAQGGTGVTAITENAVLIGGATTIAEVTASSVDMVLTSTAGAPSFQYVQVLRDSAGLAVVESTGVASAVNNLNISNATTGNAPIVSAVGTDTNIDIVLQPKGTGVVSVAGTTDYEANVTDDDDIPNKKYVDQLVFDNSGNIVRRATETFTAGATSVAIDTALPDPVSQDVYVKEVTVYVQTVLEAASTIYARIYDGTNTLVDHTELDMEAVGTYKASLPMMISSNGTQLNMQFFSDATYTNPLSVTAGNFTVTAECIKI